MPPYDVQDLVASHLTALGYHIEWVSPPGKDGGIDIIARTTTFDEPIVSTGWYPGGSPILWAQQAGRRIPLDRLESSGSRWPRRLSPARGRVPRYLVNDVRAGDQFELRGPIGGYFVWTAVMPDPLCLIGGSGIAPLMAMLRHPAPRQAQRSHTCFAAVLIQKSGRRHLS
jgi:NAD(P)H-flavin reductase